MPVAQHRPSSVSSALVLALNLAFCSGRPLPPFKFLQNFAEDGQEAPVPVADAYLFASDQQKAEDLIEGDLLPSDYLLRIVKEAEENTALNPPHYHTAYGADDNALAGKRRTRRAAVNVGKHSDLLWPNGIVPYAYDPNIKQDQRSRVAIRRAIRHWQEKTCIRFVPWDRKIHKDYIVFYDAGNEPCSSHYGRIKGPQQVKIGHHCNHEFGKVVHELGHVIGFLHEQSRPDRDHYIRVLWENIPNKRRIQRNFQKFPAKFINSLDVAYDYDSVMHYDSHAFSSNGEKTIVALDNVNRTLGQRHGLSEKDTEQANRLYQCLPPQPPSCLTRKSPVQVGNSLSFMYKQRKWLHCYGGLCRRASCHAFSKERCGPAPIAISCLGNIFQIQARGRNHGDILHIGDEVMLRTEDLHGMSVWTSLAKSSRQLYSYSDCPSNSTRPWTSCQENVFTIHTHNRTAQALYSAVHENDRIAFCQAHATNPSDKSQYLRCMSCGGREGPACRPVFCHKDLHNCHRVAFTVRQWTQNLQQENQ